MAVEKLAGAIGSPGRFQIILYLMLCCNSFFVAWNHLGMAFMGAKTKHHCDVGNASMVANLIPPVSKPGGRAKWDGCHVYVNKTSKEIRSCPNGWSYDLKGRVKTIISQWDLVCDDSYKANLATTIYFCGVLLGGLVFGTLSDKFGRRPVLLICLFSSSVVGLLLFLIDNYVAFVVLRFILGVLLQGLQASCYISIIELFALKYRGHMGTIQVIFWAAGGVMVLPLIAYIFQDWKYIQLFITTTTLLQAGLIWMLPESFRWLIVHKRFDKAEQVIRRIAKFNRLPFPRDIFDETVVENKSKESETAESRKYTFIDLFRFRVLRKRSIVMALIWFSSSVGYYGISLNISSLAGDKYLNFFISGVLELGAYILTVFVTARFGRRKPLFAYLLLGSLTNIAAGVLSEEADNDSLQKLTTALAIIGKVGVACSFSVVFIYTSELFPTEIRERRVENLFHL
ncbi:solute carrier family 22 member 5-like isoform X2 [Xenia sp. Carnegie-2017]|uniref:solute carrier family 22 member 5-like isoform X2 n=1 Tax=Xenia sp. Carnegie-2017 TaxID=2897299 RepID=UPI001F04B135|nr:solute carrier family 22 member 5-like isoform X2 [Xenia sp. Carnegie-2017]